MAVGTSKLPTGTGTHRWERVRRAIPAGHRRLSLAKQFALASLAVLLVGMLIIGAWAGGQAKDAVLTRLSTSAGLYVSSVIADDLQSLVSNPTLDDAAIARLDWQLAQTPLGSQIVTFKVWAPGGRVLYSPNRALIGRTYPVDADLAAAFTGKLTADVSHLNEPENEFERQHWHRLLQVYVPVREHNQGGIIAAAEFYQLPAELDREVRSAQLRSWAMVIGVMAVMYAVLAAIVKRGSDTIGRQRVVLAQKVQELTALLAENQRLHERVRQAAARTTTLNQQALRRISADLHDGPGQALALALLRLDGARGPSSGAEPAVTNDFAVVEAAVRDALGEIRAISAGLRLPVLTPLSPDEVVARVVRDHQNRTGVVVAVATRNVPTDAPLPVKIALFRALQESLSNATRHGGGTDVSATLWSEPGLLYLDVTDGGPGFAPATVGGDGHLGLAGMREQAELLGGSFAVESHPGDGTTVHLCWPLEQGDEEDHE